MTEKEKRQRQMLYDANYNEALLQEMAWAKDLCHQYNQLRPSDRTGQREILMRLLGKTKQQFTILAPFWCDYGYNIDIGENFFANHNLVDVYKRQAQGIVSMILLSIALTLSVRMFAAWRASRR